MLIFALLAGLALGIDLGDPNSAKKAGNPPISSENRQIEANSAEIGRFSDELAQVQRKLAEIDANSGKLVAADLKIELLSREIADLRSQVAENAKNAEKAKKTADFPPAPPAKPKMWYLVDSTGKEWQDPDPENLKRWVRLKNQQAATPKFTAYRTYDELAFPPQSTVAYQPASPQVLTPPAVTPAPPVYYAMPSSWGSTSIGGGGTWSSPTYGATYSSPMSYGSFGGGGILGGLFGGGGCVGGSCR